MFGILETIEPFTVLLALLPLLAYLMVISAIRLSGHALVTTGGRDIAALAMAISGLLAVGPTELFFPMTAATLFGPKVWFALAAFYALCTTLIVLTSTPRLVIYGRTPEEMFEPLLAAARKIDAQAQGENRSLQVRLPQSGVLLRLGGQRAIDYAEVVAFEPNLSPRFWKSLLVQLRSEVSVRTSPMPRRGFAMLIFALLLGSVLVWQSVGNRDLVVEGFREWLWR